MRWGVIAPSLTSFLVSVFSSTQCWILFQLTEACAAEFALSSATALLAYRNVCGMVSGSLGMGSPLPPWLQLSL